MCQFSIEIHAPIPYIRDQTLTLTNRFQELRVIVSTIVSEMLPKFTEITKKTNVSEPYCVINGNRTSDLPNFFIL